ncbi:MAG: 5-methyltetrahydropteroyltriglutamate--homocysteine S-methyltransferase [Pseudobdellovibrionaceae bacterium]
MVLATNLGFPRIGSHRELKKATESYWKGNLTREELLTEGANLRKRHWELQKKAGLDHIPSNDFSYYDTMLDTSCLLGCVPERYGWTGGDIDLDLYFAMARGSQKNGRDVIACEMTKWFDTNYHYIVPEFADHQVFTLSSTKIFDEFKEAMDMGIATRPVLVGPITYLALGKCKDGTDPMALLPKILPVYEEIIRKLDKMGAGWLQLDEPLLAMDLTPAQKDAFKIAYPALNLARGDMKLLVTSYFESLRDNTALALSLPVQGLHLDLRRGPEQLDAVLDKVPDTMTLSLGLVDGRYIWKNDLSASLDSLEKAAAKLGKDRIMVAPSCSMLHVPIDLSLEDKMDSEIKGWMAFATQKLAEIVTLKKGLAEGRGAIVTELAASDATVKARQTSPRIHNQAVGTRLAAVTSDMSSRTSPFAKRREAQVDAYNLPAYPTTTIGSFPQTQEIRLARAAYKKGTLPEADYEEAMKKEIAEVVKYQEEIDMDVLVHGEAERNDMVEYFGEQLEGYVFSKLGWVQSYGSRCVKPPIIFGDVSRPEPMTVAWSAYAQSLTDKPMKAMLTGPITILFWSFKRDDVSLETSCRQIALAIRDEVADLEKAGITFIQVDEPAIREGLPLRAADRAAYLDWAVDSFKLSTCCVADTTQIHTHMCYSEFNDIIKAIAALDADVISIETSRSQMELLDAFVSFNYPNEIGPGVYDIHSPRIPSMDEMKALLEKAARVIPEEHLWVNPDCGLKTRGWAEVKPALEHMIAAAKAMRARKAKTAVA